MNNATPIMFGDDGRSQQRTGPTNIQDNNIQDFPHNKTTPLFTHRGFKGTDGLMEESWDTDGQAAPLQTLADGRLSLSRAGEEEEEEE